MFGSRKPGCLGCAGRQWGKRNGRFEWGSDAIAG